MRVLRQKHIKKVMRFFNVAFGVRPPYKIVLDGTFIHSMVKNKLPLAETLAKLLAAEVQVFTTRFVIAELTAIGEAPQRTRGTPITQPRRRQKGRGAAQPGTHSQGRRRDTERPRRGPRSQREKREEDEATYARRAADRRRASGGGPRGRADAQGPQASGGPVQGRRGAVTAPYVPAREHSQVSRGGASLAPPFHRPAALPHRPTGSWPRAGTPTCGPPRYRYLVAVQDPKLRAMLGRIPGIPLMCVREGLWGALSAIRRVALPCSRKSGMPMWGAGPCGGPGPAPTDHEHAHPVAICRCA